jgi:hypothetical protein
MRYPITGNTAAAASVTVYNQGTVVAATIFAAATGGSALAGGIVTADSDGKVIFFVDDATYPVISYFDISAAKSGYTTQTVTNVWAAFNALLVPVSVSSSTTELSICNAALGAIGASALVALSDTTVQADVVNLWYPICRDSLLRSHPWNFAEKRASLTAVVGTTPVMDFAYFFDLPSDCLKLRRLSDENVGITYKVEGRRIACDEATITILYTFKQTDVTYYDALFVKCLIFLLAQHIAMPIKQDVTLFKTMSEMYEDAIAEARGVDAQEGTPDVQYCNDLLDVR